MIRKISSLMSVTKPWGSFKLLTKNEKTTVKIISLNAGNRTSLQLHNHRSEKWLVLKGEGIVTLEKPRRVKISDEIHIPVNTSHRIEAITDLTILEISYGIFDELDILRLEDDFGR
jgi:mannose-1-phosphate guanylyltransferase